MATIYPPTSSPRGQNILNWLFSLCVGGLISHLKELKVHIWGILGAQTCTLSPTILPLRAFAAFPAPRRLTDRLAFLQQKKKPGKALPLRPSWHNLAQLRLHTINSFSDLRVHGLDGAIFQFVSKTRLTPPDNGVS